MPINNFYVRPVILGEKLAKNILETRFLHIASFLCMNVVVQSLNYVHL